MKTSVLVFLLAIVPFFPGFQKVRADVRLPSILANKMVLQQRSAVRFWGWADPGEEVSVKASWMKSSVTTKANDLGSWVVLLKTTSAGGPYTITIAGKNRIVLHNILLGEVWVCSGQSNMEFSIKMLGGWDPYYSFYKNELGKEGFPQIRLCQIAKAVSPIPVDTCTASWKQANVSTVETFSAVAYFYGRELYRKLHVPIGLISANWGGTPAEAWTDRSYLARDAELNFYLGAPNLSPAWPSRPSLLYNAMIHPIVNYCIRGVIWYQGESNRNDADTYADLLATLIRNWRDAWNEGSFPFYYVQISPFAYDEPYPSSAYLREAQLSTLAVPNTGMAVTMDIGDTHDIHPKNKPEVARRLALWAIARTYGIRGKAYSGPVYSSMRAEKNRIRLFFDCAENGLQTPGGSLTGFTIADCRWQFVKAMASIEGKSVLVWNDTLDDPVAVRYAFTNTDSSVLFNSEGLPASSFRTDTKPFFVRQVNISLTMDAAGDGVAVSMKTHGNDARIRYTLDGSLPTLTSPLFESNILLRTTTQVTAVAFRGHTASEYVAHAHFIRHKGFGKKITLLQKPSEKYAGAPNTLLDGVEGSVDFRDGTWQGFEGDDLDAVIDLGDTTVITSVSPRFLQDVASWIFLPKSVEVSISSDGINYTPVAEVKNDISVKQEGAFRKSFPVKLQSRDARFIRIHATNIGVCPESHPGAGQKAWIFTDEIVIE